MYHQLDLFVAGQTDIKQQGNTAVLLEPQPLRDGVEFANVQRVFEESKTFQFTAPYRITSPRDVAYIFKQLETSSIENSFAVLVKEHKPTVLHLAIGTFSRVMIPMEPIMAADKRIHADEIYFIHNHPSGKVVASNADMAIYTNMRQIFGERLQPGIIINTRSGHYGMFTGDNPAIGPETIATEENQTYAIPTYSFSKLVFNKNYREAGFVRSSMDVAAFVSGQRLGDRPKLSYIILSNSNEIQANVHTHYSKLKAPDYMPLAKRIADDIITYGGASIITYGSCTLNASEVRRLQKNLREAIPSESGNVLLDHINIKNNINVGLTSSFAAAAEKIYSYESAADEGWLREPGERYAISYSAEHDEIQGIALSRQEIKDRVKEYVETLLAESDIDAKIVDTAIHGSRGRGTAKPESDLDVVIEYRGDMKEDGMFNILNEEPLYIDGVRVDINPIRPEETGTLAQYMERSREYDLRFRLSEPATKYERRFQDGIDADRIFDMLGEKSDHYLAGAFRIISDLENYYGGTLQSASGGAAHALERGLVPFTGNKFSGQDMEYHHMAFIMPTGERAVEAVPFTTPETLRSMREDLRFRAVYHGSGANFEAFDHSHMGEGEGAQTYGWGTYVTEVEGIGRAYAEVKGDSIFKGPVGFKWFQLINDRMSKGEDFESIKQDFLQKSKGSYEKVKFSEGYTSFIADYEKLANLREDEIRNRNLYMVDIPEDNGCNYLKWEKPLSDGQISAIREYLKENFRKNKQDDFESSIAEVKDAPNSEAVNAWTRRGENVYKTLISIIGTDKEASKALAEMGFTGISYPAQHQSGGRSDGKRNFVIFNEADAKITDHVRFRLDQSNKNIKKAPMERSTGASSNETGLRTNHQDPVISFDSSNETGFRPNHQDPVVSFDDTTKIRKNLDIIVKNYEKIKRPHKFIGEISSAIGLRNNGNHSNYGTFKAKNGVEFRLRISDHNAASKNFDDAGYKDGLSIVVSRKPNKGITNDGVAHITEYYYNAYKLAKAEGRPLADIARSLQQALYSGEYKDLTGLAERHEVNAEELADRLSSPIRIVKADEIRHSDPDLEKRLRDTKGWYDASTGEVFVVFDNIMSVNDFKQTVLHEVVGHKGLRAVVGQKAFGTLCESVYRSMPATEQRTYLKRYGSRSIAGEEYMATLAEQDVHQNTPVWNKVTTAVKVALNSIGIQVDYSIGEMRELLRRSTRQLERTLGSTIKKVPVRVNGVKLDKGTRRQLALGHSVVLDLPDKKTGKDKPVRLSWSEKQGLTGRPSLGGQKHKI